MCTMTWLLHEGGYDIFFNRDELNSRQQADAPACKQIGHAHYIAPTDSDAGGTWIGVNQAGLTCALLNHYAAAKGLDPSLFQSRGHIIPDLMQANSLAQALDRLRHLPLQRYRPFTLVIIAPDQTPRVCVWDGELHVDERIQGPLTSSSYQTDTAIVARLAYFADQFGERQPNTDDLLSFHASHGHADPAFGVCMHRDDGHSVSLTHIRVANGSVQMNYADGSPCTTPLQHGADLQLITQSSGSSATARVA